MVNERKYWEEQVEGVLECYSDEYAEEIGANNLTEDDMINIVDRVLNDGALWSNIDSMISEIIDEYCTHNKNK